MTAIPTAWSLCSLTRDAWLAMPVDLRIRLAASAYLGWRYASERPRVAYASPAVPESLVGGEPRIDCSTLTASILTAVYPAAAWDRRAYEQIQVIGQLPAHPDSPIRAVERLGIGTRVDAVWPGQWALMQGWRELGSRPRGHALLVRGGLDGAALVLESTDRDDLVGPRWLGTTWADLARRYAAARYLARLT